MVQVEELRWTAVGGDLFTATCGDVAGECFGGVAWTFLFGWRPVLPPDQFPPMSLEE